MPSSPDNSISDTTPAEIIPSETASATPKWDKVEQERLTRRAALRKMGYTSGIALFSMFAVDDLARMAIQKMEQHKETQQIAETVAKEFESSGIALANFTSSVPCGYNTFPGCWNCCHKYNTDMNALEANMSNCAQQGHSYAYCSQLYSYDSNSSLYENNLNTCSDNCAQSPCKCTCTSE